MYVCVYIYIYIYTYIYICTTPSLSIYLSLNIGCFHVLAIVNSASVNIGVYVSFQITVLCDDSLLILFFVSIFILLQEELA